MELSDNGFSDEFLASRRESIVAWPNFPPGPSSFSAAVDDFLPPWWNPDLFPDNPDLAPMPNPVGMCDHLVDDGTECPAFDQSCYYPLLEEYATRLPLPFQGPGLQFPAMVEEDDLGRDTMKAEDIDVALPGYDVLGMGCCVEEKMAVVSSSSSSSCLGGGGGGRGGNGTPGKKSEGHPSKNLMAERRRRKRLNDRLSMLRSIVPKISKMDRTSILADTIDYMKELLEKINKMQQEQQHETPAEAVHRSPLNLTGITQNSDVLVRNSPKFDVERRESETRIDICCTTRPGLLLSTVNTLEALGLELHQCVISCFGDFSMQASCSEEMDNKAVLSPDDIKQALFRNAGYGGGGL